MKISIIFCPTGNTADDFPHKLKVINRNFRILENIILKVPDEYYFEGAYQIFPPYDDEKHFIKVMNNFAEFYNIPDYFYTDADGMKYLIKNKTKIPADKLEIITENAEETGEIPAMAYGYMINKKYPELKPIRDINFTD